MMTTETETTAATTATATTATAPVTSPNSPSTGKSTIDPTLAAVVADGYTRQRERLLALARKLVHSPQGEQDAEDLVEIAWERAMTPGAGQFDLAHYLALRAEHGQVAADRLQVAHLAQIMARLAIDWGRRRHTRAGHPLSLDGAWAANGGQYGGSDGAYDEEYLDIRELVGGGAPAGAGEDPAAVVTRRETIREAMSLLPRRTQFVMVLMSRGYRLDEIAALLRERAPGQHTIGSLKSEVFRHRRTIRALNAEHAECVEAGAH